MSEIILDSVSVDFPIYNLNARSFKKQLLSFTTGGLIKDQERKCVVVKALDNISCKISDGDRVALIGHNGAGKSTFLRVLAKIYEPSSGNIHFNGNVYPLFDIKLGFNQESTGYENIFLRGLLLGFSKAKLLEKIDEIIEFSGLGNYIHMPIRTYSQGMQMRLAFSVTVNVEPDILLLDEAIGAGDKDFKAKAQAKLSELMEKAKIVVLASHDNNILERICNKAFIFTHGKITFVGSVKDALDVYNGKTDAPKTSIISPNRDPSSITDTAVT